QGVRVLRQLRNDADASHSLRHGGSRGIARMARQNGYGRSREVGRSRGRQRRSAKRHYGTPARPVRDEGRRGLQKRPALDEFVAHKLWSFARNVSTITAS